MRKLVFLTSDDQNWVTSLLGIKNQVCSMNTNTLSIAWVNVGREEMKQNRRMLIMKKEIEQKKTLTAFSPGAGSALLVLLFWWMTNASAAVAAVVDRNCCPIRTGKSPRQHAAYISKCQEIKNMGPSRFPGDLEFLTVPMITFENKAQKCFPVTRGGVGVGGWVSVNYGQTSSWGATKPVQSMMCSCCRCFLGADFHTQSMQNLFQLIQDSHSCENSYAKNTLTLMDWAAVLVSTIIIICKNYEN